MITLTREEAAKMLHYMDDGGTYTDDYGKLIETLRARLAQPEPEPVRLRRGDILRCIETNELCTVWATSTTGKTQVKWKANDFGEYTAEQISDLFWVEPKPEPEPVAWYYAGSDVEYASIALDADLDEKQKANCTPLYTAPPQREWQGLTDDEIKEILDCGRPNLVNIKKAEQKLKEKNG
jgi:hypothetical protein